jgi:hypothetical protein
VVEPPAGCEGGRFSVLSHVHKTRVFSALQQLLLLLVAAFAFQLISTALIVTKTFLLLQFP